MSLFQRFMRILTHPQHAGEPLPAKKPKPAKPERAKPQDMRAKQDVSSAQAATASKPVAVATRPAAKIPTAPAKPVEVFSPARPASMGNSHLGMSPLMDDPDDSGVDLIRPETGLDLEPGPSPIRVATPNVAKAIEPVPMEPQGHQLDEVLDLIEKLRTHVDAQNGRFEQAMGVLDQIRSSAAVLPEIRERIDSMLASMDDLRERQIEGHAQVERALAAQSARLDAIAHAIERATQREERLSESLLEINQTIRAVTGTNDRLANAIESMRRHEAERDARIGRALTGAQRWLMVLSLVLGLGMLATIITAVVVGG
ncbi:MAG: hypothetical protein KIT54_11275 [Phycisphaeraceae bacterium]|nr:hypothetical protein [Phycisphaeraceae bacterium]